MGLFSKKQCSLCGGDIGLLGNRKLDDGNMCKHCAALISPWLTGRRKMTVSDMQAHLEYRRQNAALLSQFYETRVLGTGRWTVHFDDNQRLFFVTDGSQDNPDVIAYYQITGCRPDIREYVHTHAAPPPAAPAPAPGPATRPGGPAGGPGARPGAPAGGPGARPGAPAGGPGARPGAPAGGPGARPGAPAGGPGARPGAPAGGRPAPGPAAPPPPPVTTRSYDFYIYLTVNSPWFDEISFRLNPAEIDEHDRPMYDAAAYEAQTICDALAAAAQG